VAETHISTLFFVGDRVYKLKKPVTTGFLDWSSKAARRSACFQEVALNRRIAPDVYLGVLDIVDEHQVRQDSVVAMRRLPQECTLANLAKAGVPLDDTLRALARQLTDFHEHCRHDDEVDAAATPQAVLRLWTDNLAEMDGFGASGVVEAGVLDWVRAASTAYVRGRSALFQRRIGEGRIRDGHGDLLADDIFVLDDGLRVLDCLEFDARLRFGDVLADVAFLAMDLERLGAGPAGWAFLRWYQDFSGDTWPASLAHHWVAYRALVRSKVACLRAAQGDVQAPEQARFLARCCQRHLRHATVRLVLVGGLPGTGKTVLAANLAGRLGWASVSSDEIRRGLLDSATTPDTAKPPTSRRTYGEGRYRPEMTAATYQTLLDHAARCLQMGESVILDASWTDRHWREQAADLAARCSAQLVELACEVTPEVAAARIERRLAKGTGASEATPAVAAQMAQQADPWPQARRIDTTATKDQVLVTALGFVAPEVLAEPPTR